MKPVHLINNGDHVNLKFDLRILILRCVEITDNQCNMNWV